MAKQPKIEPRFTLKVEAEFRIGEIVYLVTDPKQLKRMVTGVMTTDESCTMYQVRHKRDEASYHFDIELSLTPDIIDHTEASKDDDEED